MWINSGKILMKRHISHISNEVFLLARLSIINDKDNEKRQLFIRVADDKGEDIDDHRFSYTCIPRPNCRENNS
ncbi:MAG: hypothetical protein K0S76_881 [Herbinix sp.]|jgi:hypothetical protein|nr:hypothetical protein [Herbinix sp.]